MPVQVSNLTIIFYRIFLLRLLRSARNDDDRRLLRGAYSATRNDIPVLSLFGDRDRVFSVFGIPQGDEFIAGLADTSQMITSSMTLTILKDHPLSYDSVNAIHFIFRYYRRVVR